MKSNLALHAGEEMFVRYLREYGYAGWDKHEPVIVEAQPSNPDFLIQRGRTETICEVKEFRTDHMKRKLCSSPTKRASFPAKRILQPVREAIRAAGKQLRPFADGDRPLVIVLTNPHNADVQLRVERVLEAMYGDPMVAVNKNAPFLGKNGKLTNNNYPHLSAVVCLRKGSHADDWLGEEHGQLEQWKRRVSISAGLPWEAPPGMPTGGYVAVDTIETMSSARGDAATVPDDFFDGPHDTRWTFDGKKDYILVRP